MIKLYNYFLSEYHLYSSDFNKYTIRVIKKMYQVKIQDDFEKDEDILIKNDAALSDVDEMSEDETSEE